ncbi:molybdenum cofactor sulfurase 3 isoform X2 [Pectobacterium phage POP12]|nr:molybdenum cofactor sulfurase 3 isoform X2 [Pectobacterium phage POP12]
MKFELNPDAVEWFVRRYEAVITADPEKKIELGYAETLYNRLKSYMATNGVTLSFNDMRGKKRVPISTHVIVDSYDYGTLVTFIQEES